MVHFVWSLYGVPPRVTLVHLGYLGTLFKMPKFGRPSGIRRTRSLGSSVRLARRLYRRGRELWGSARSALSRFSSSSGYSGDRAPSRVSVPRSRKRARVAGRVSLRVPRTVIRNPYYKASRMPQTALRAASTYEGNFKGRLPRGGLYRNMSKYEKLGYVIEFESGGITSDQEAVYFMHGMPNQVLLEAVCGGMARKALDKFNFSIKGWNTQQLTQSTSDLFQWFLSYKTTPTGPITTVASAGAAGNQTALVWAIDLANLFCNIVTSGLTYVEFTTVRGQWTRSGGGDFLEEWRQETMDIDVHFKLMSNLTLQNRTPAATGVADETSALDVANNPVNVKVFRCSSNQVFPRSQDVGVGNVFLTLDKGTGFATVGASVANVAGGMKKVPDWHQFTYTYSQTRSTIGPGNMKDDVFYITKVMRLNSFITKMMDFLRTGTTSGGTNNACITRFPSKMIGIDRRLDTRTSEPPVTIGFEVNQKLGCYITCKKRYVPLRMLAGIV